MQQYTTLEEIIALIPVSAATWLWINLGSLVLILIIVILCLLFDDKKGNAEGRKLLNGTTMGIFFMVIWMVGITTFIFAAPRAADTATQALVSNIQMKYKVASGVAVERYDVMVLKNGSSLDENSHQVIFNLILENGSAYPNAVVRFADNGEPFLTMAGDITEASILRTAAQ